jgi:membrane protein insertase Oxa1/YidC/SpoIIIJ
MVLLSIGTILLQQFVTMRSQKDQQKYSSVDGQGGSQQKMTMIIMTVMFAIFSFMYSAAFSIYMVFGNLFSLATTLLINKIVDVRENKKAAAELEAKYNKRFRGQVKAQDNKKKKGK